jgi:hypothetical protein
MVSFLILLNIILIDLIYNYVPNVRIIFNYPIRIIKSFGLLTKKINKLSAISSALSICSISIALSILYLAIYLSMESLKIIVDQGYSIFHIYSTYGIIIAFLITLDALAVALIVALMVSIIFSSLTYQSYKLVLSLHRLLSDQVKFRSISLKSDSRPKTTTEAIQLLNSFKSDWSRVQYARTLLKWMPSGEDPQRLIEEANKIRASGEHSVEVSDAIYALAEVREDSMPK